MIAAIWPINARILGGKRIPDFFRLFALFCLCQTLPVLAQENLPIRQVRFLGNESIPESELREQLGQKDVRGFSRLLFWQPGDDFSGTVLKQDLQRLQNTYQRQGFLQARIESEKIISSDGESVDLLFRIDEGQPVLVDSVAFVISPADSHATVLLMAFDRKKMRLHPPMRFRDDEFETDHISLARYFSAAGYPFVKIHPLFSVDSTRQHVRIVYRIDTGVQCRFGPVRVIDNRYVATSSILKQIAFQSGELVSDEKLHKSQKQIYQLGLFNFVVLRLLQEELNGTTLPVEVRVREAQRLTVKWGVGYGREEQFRTFIDITRLAVLGRDRRIRLILRHSSLEPYHANLSWIKPAVILPSISLVINPFVRREKEPGFTIDRLGSAFTLQSRIAEQTDASLKYSFEQDRLSLSSLMRREALDDIEAKLYNKSTIEFGFFSDRSSPVFNPSRGYSLGCTAALSGVGLDSDFHYLRSLVDFRRYRSFADRWIWAMRLKIGAIQPIWGDSITPIEERFYAGGSTSIRGWSRSRLGPSGQNNEPLGGNSVAEMSQECRFPIWGQLSGVAFIEGGNVWTLSFAFPLDELQYAAGCGLRLNTPIGPIRLDFGTPVFTGRRPWQVFLSFGQAF